MKKRTSTTTIIIHCSATRSEANVRAHHIRQWHVEKGWADIGYHFVICRDGAIERGRDQDAVGAHAKGANDYSIGICMVGGLDLRGAPSDDYTPAQWASLKTLVLGLMAEYPGIESVIGHRDVPGVKKDCPCFDVADWLKRVRA